MQIGVHFPRGGEMSSSLYMAKGFETAQIAWHANYSRKDDSARGKLLKNHLGILLEGLLEIPGTIEDEEEAHQLLSSAADLCDRQFGKYQPETGEALIGYSGLVVYGVRKRSANALVLYRGISSILRVPNTGKGNPEMFADLRSGKSSKDDFHRYKQARHLRIDGATFYLGGPEKIQRGKTMGKRRDEELAFLRDTLGISIKRDSGDC